MSKSIELVKAENLRTRPEENVSSWEEIDGWEDSSHEVKILWRVENGENRFSLQLLPKSQDFAATSAEVTPDVALQAWHEHHVYPFVAPVAGHWATANALGIKDAA